MLPTSFEGDTVDLTGLVCPLPLLRLKVRLKSESSGARLRVLTSDPASVRDFRAFCDAVGHALVSVETGLSPVSDSTVYAFLIEVRHPGMPEP